MKIVILEPKLDALKDCHDVPEFHQYYHRIAISTINFLENWVTLLARYVQLWMPVLHKIRTVASFLVVHFLTNHPSTQDFKRKS